jgi:hypothetical protein
MWSKNPIPVVTKRRGGFEIHAAFDARLARGALDARAARGQLPHDRRPGLSRRAVTPHEETPHANVARELKICIAVSNHPASCKINRVPAKVTLDECRRGLAAGAGIRGRAGTRTPHQSAHPVRRMRQS